MRLSVFIGALCFAAVASCVAAYPLYKQCGEPYSNDKLGTSSNTICSAGCAMSSVAMALNNGMNPGQLNQWLINHGGYADGDLIIWASVNALGSMTFYNRYVGAGSLHLSDLAHYVSEGHPVILNVRGGSHWVLATHVSGSTVSVNDPGFNQNSYDYSEASNFVVYSK